MYTGSLATADFSGAVFTCSHFLKDTPNTHLMQFLLHKEFFHSCIFGLTIDFSAADLVHADFFQT